LGKPEVATITLNAYQGGNQIFVEISDDGRGLDVDAIKKKVIEKNLATPEALANMDDSDIYNFYIHTWIFHRKGNNRYIRPWSWYECC
jgi:two-component system chemotaxis sensor kinase CheA